jgi:hypothetical protein
MANTTARLYIRCAAGYPNTRGKHSLVSSPRGVDARCWGVPPDGEKGIQHHRGLQRYRVLVNSIVAAKLRVTHAGIRCTLWRSGFEMVPA